MLMMLDIGKGGLVGELKLASLIVEVDYSKYTLDDELG